MKRRSRLPGGGDPASVRYSDSFLRGRPTDSWSTEWIGAPGTSRIGQTSASLGLPEPRRRDGHEKRPLGTSEEPVIHGLRSSQDEFNSLPWRSRAAREQRTVLRGAVTPALPVHTDAGSSPLQVFTHASVRDMYHGLTAEGARLLPLPHSELSHDLNPEEQIEATIAAAGINAEPHRILGRVSGKTLTLADTTAA